MYILYGTLGCHLCDDAQSILDQVGIHYCYVDIIDDELLLTTFGEHIPVLKTESGSVLYWPFSLEQVKAFCKQPPY